MNQHKTTLEVIPSARRLVHSLRDVGYDFRHAVADLIDNSITADATSVDIEMRFDGNESFLRIADNGKGMNSLKITEAMRFGTDRSYDSDELGKFGLGLKTASLSQCSKLTVASRTDGNPKHIEARQWDLAHIECTNRWEIINLPVDNCPKSLLEPLQKSSGTVVLWEILDRVIEYKIPWGDCARKGFLELAEELEKHLSMVFHRFLSGEAKRKQKLRITLNGNNIDPWDPFAKSEKATIRFPSQHIKVQGDRGIGLVLYSPYILPPQWQFSSAKAFNKYSGPNRWNYQQGFYIYRADRMIQSGGWSYIRTSDEHTKLARVALDFWPDLDSAFEVNVAKARVNLPSDLRLYLKPLIEQLAKEARKKYTPHFESFRTNGAVSTKYPDTAVIGQSNISDIKLQISEESEFPNKIFPGNRKLAYIGQAIDEAARMSKENAALRSIKETLKVQSPQVADEIGW